MAQTIENSYHSTSNDMGSSHTKIHENQHDRLVDGEPLIETLTANKPTDESFDLMKKMAVQQGVKSESEWRVYNSKIRPVRRKNSYDEYLSSLCNKVVGGLNQRLNKKTTPRSKRANYAQQLASIEKNHGVPIDGSLFYLSNFHDYDNLQVNKADYIRYRKFERETFKSFFNSKEFKTLNPGCFRAEIHFDELGTMHLQTQSVWFKTDKRGRAQYSKRGSIKNALIKYYGSTKELNRRLDILSAIHADPKLTRKIGTERIDAKYNRMVNDPAVNVERASSPERLGRLEELWRIEQLNVLSDTGLKMAKQYDVDWQPATTYQTDGQHRTRDSYIEHERQTEQVERANQEQLTKTSKELTDTQNELKRSKQELADSQRAVKREKQRISRLKQNINDSFENITGAERPDNMNDLDAIRVIRYHVKSAKSERDKTEQENEALKLENQRLKQEQAQMKQLNIDQPWYVLRQLIVDIIQALMPVLRELDHDSVTGQKWRDSVTEQVDRQMKQSTLINTFKKPQKYKSKELER